MALVKRSTQVFLKKEENLSDFTFKPHIRMMECKFNVALRELRNNNTVHNRKYFYKTKALGKNISNCTNIIQEVSEYLCMLHILGNIYF
jgi:hypothetical protein